MTPSVEELRKMWQRVCPFSHDEHGICAANVQPLLQHVPALLDRLEKLEKVARMARFVEDMSFAEGSHFERLDEALAALDAEPA